MKTPYTNYAEFKAEIQRMCTENKSFFFEEKWGIEAWEMISKVNSIYDEPFYKEYLACFDPLTYLNWSWFIERPDTTTDWDLLLKLLVSSPIIEDYNFVTIHPKKLENCKPVDKVDFRKIPEVTFKFKDLETHLLSFTDIFDYTDIDDIDNMKNFEKINISVADFLHEAMSLHSSLFEDTIYLSELPKFDIDFLFKLLIFQSICDSKNSHFNLGFNFPQNKTELLKTYKQKIADFESKIRKIYIE